MNFIFMYIYILIYNIYLQYLLCNMQSKIAFCFNNNKNTLKSFSVSHLVLYNNVHYMGYF